MTATEFDWEPVRESYETSPRTIPEIADEHGVSLAALRRQARLGLWKRPPRPGRPRYGLTDKPAHEAPAAGPRKTRLPPPSPPLDTPPGRRRLLERLYRTIDRRLLLLEDQLDDDTLLPPADRERASREIGSLINQIKGVDGLDDAAKSTAKAGAANATKEAERLRDELAARLERLLRSWLERGPG
jgi:hypothetical protein